MSRLTKVSENIVKIIAEAVPLVKGGSDKNILKWINYCNKNLRLMNKVLKQSKTLGEKKNIESNIGLVKYYSEVLKRLLSSGSGVTKNKSIIWKDIKSAFKSRVRTAVILNQTHKDPNAFLSDCTKTIIRRVKKILKELKNIKLNTALCCEFKKVSDVGNGVPKYISTANEIINHGTNLEELMSKIKDNLLTRLDELEQEGSGWTLTSIINLAVNINKYSPIQ